MRNSLRLERLNQLLRVSDAVDMSQESDSNWISVHWEFPKNKQFALICGNSGEVLEFKRLSGDFTYDADPKSSQSRGVVDNRIYRLLQKHDFLTKTVGQ